MIHNLKNYLYRFISGTYQNIKRNRNKNKILATYKQKPRAKDLYISMTTYEPRLLVFEYAVLSILRGTILPEKILIYVPKGFKNLVLNNPNSFIKDELEYGLIQIIEMDEDLGPHSKFFYSFKDFGSNKDIVICDDDVVYYKDWLKGLILAAESYPDFGVFAYKTVNVTVKGQEVLPYEDLIHLDSGNKPINGLMYAEGVGGVLYRKGLLLKEVLNKDVFMDLLPKADDVWLWYCSYLNKVKIKHIKPISGIKLLFIIPGSQIVNLWTENTINKRNDKYVYDCRRYFIEEYDMDIIKFI